MSPLKGPPWADHAIRDLAGQQEGIVTAAHLAALGLTRGAVRHRLASGRLVLLHPGVFAVGHACLSREARWLAAVWACGPNAALSHRDAGALHRVRRSNRRRIDVSTPDRGRKGHPGIDLHRVRRLHPDDVTMHGLIPVTTVARTIVDLCEVDPRSVPRAFHEADVQRLLDVPAVVAAMDRVTGRRTLRPLRRVVAEAVDAPPDGGELARRFLELCRAGALTPPVAGTEVEVNGRQWEVDFAWPRFGVAVETDGAAVHHTRRAFERDRLRDADFAVEGWVVLRFTWRRLRDEPAEVAAVVRRVLAARGWAPERS